MKDMKIELNMKSIMLFEQLTDKSFYSVNDQDMVMLLYSIIVVNNPEYKLTLPEFDNILKNKKLSQRMLDNLQEEISYINSLSVSKKKDTDNENEEKVSDPVKISDVLGQFIITYHMDPHYVMYEMKLWEMEIMAKAIETTVQQGMEEKRFWTYLNILPHVDAKKIGGPQKFLPFEWEKEEGKKSIDAEKFLKENNEKILGLFKNNEKIEKEDAERVENKPE